MIRKQLDMRHKRDSGIKMTLRSSLEAAWWMHDKDINRHTDQGRGGSRRKATSPLGLVVCKGFRDGQVGLLFGRWLEIQSLYPRIWVRTETCIWESSARGVKGHSQKVNSWSPDHGAHLQPESRHRYERAIQGTLRARAALQRGRSKREAGTEEGHVALK